MRSAVLANQTPAQSRLSAPGTEFARRLLALHYMRMPNPATSEASADTLRKQFPILDEGLYLNHAAVGPWPRCAAEAVQNFAAENLRHGPVRYADWIKRTGELRNGLARLTGAASAADIALLKNTTEGVSAVAWGLDWQAGDNLVLPRDEFPSNRLPWLAQRSRGVEVREVDIRAEGEPEAALIGAMDSRTRLLSVSAVQWSDGFRLDLQRLGDACHERGVLFFVDAIQQLGALQIDVAACRIDYLAADAHKWLLGPEGIAVFYSNAAARPLLELLQQGWHMVDNAWNFQRNDWTPAASARRFEAGSPNSLGQAAMNASVRLLLEQGMETVEDRVLANTAHLLERLPGIPGVQMASRAAAARRSGIINITVRDQPAGELHRRLSDAGVTCALRGDGIRLSPHFYQGEQEIERFAKLLETML
jgi:selenocysteine lyase/cysteine desulfurase